MLMMRSDAAFASLALLTTAAAFNFNASDLYHPNYDPTTGTLPEWCGGINVGGYDGSPESGRGTAGVDYIVPRKKQFDYFIDNVGMNCFRLPILWERLQQAKGDGELSIVDGYEDMVEYVTERNAYAIIDPHNNNHGLEFNEIDVTKGDFVVLWQALAYRFRDNPNVIFALYNEPKHGESDDGVADFFDMDSTDDDGALIEGWREWTQEAIDIIRSTGAPNAIMVPGLKFTTALDWSGRDYWGESLAWTGETSCVHGADDPTGGRCGNTRLAALSDPLNNLVYDVHQYFDDGLSGNYYGCQGHPVADPGLNQTVEWALRYNQKARRRVADSLPSSLCGVVSRPRRRCLCRGRF